MPIKILPCTCEHEFQDKRYGRGLRVHNQGGGSKSSTPKYTCSVCGKVR